MPDRRERAESSTSTEIGLPGVKALQRNHTTSAVALAQTPTVIVSMDNGHPVAITNVKFVRKRRLESLDNAFLAGRLRDVESRSRG